MIWYKEWNDIQNGIKFLEIQKKFSKNLKKKFYNSMEVNRKLYFGTKLGDAFLKEYARIVHGMSEKTEEMLLMDLHQVDKFIMKGVNEDEKFWSKLYQYGADNRRKLFHTDIGGTFLELVQVKIKLEENEEYQRILEDFNQIEKIYSKIDFNDEKTAHELSDKLTVHEENCFKTWLGHFFVGQLQLKYLSEERRKNILMRKGLRIAIGVLACIAVSCTSVGVYAKLHSREKIASIQKEVANAQELEDKGGEAADSEVEELMTDQAEGETVMGGEAAKSESDERDMKSESSEKGTTSESNEKGTKSEGDNKDMKPENNAEGTRSVSDAGGENATSDHKKPKVLSKYASVVEKYPDMVGWISIPGTVIDYPVMMSEEEGYYLEHDYSGEKNVEGSVFIDCGNSVYPADNYMVLYGHNMKNGNIFGALNLYKERDFALNSPDIFFDTIYEKGKYEVVTCFKTSIKNQEDDGFRYYQLYGYKDEKDFNEIYEFINDNKLYSFLREINYGDEILLLSTCEYSQENGRLVVVAKKVKDQEK